MMGDVMMGGELVGGELVGDVMMGGVTMGRASWWGAHNSRKLGSRSRRCSSEAAATGDRPQRLSVASVA